MSTRPDMVEIKLLLIAQMRVVMQVVVMADLMLARELPWSEQLVHRMIQVHYLNRLRGLLAAVPPDMSAEILSACEKTIGPAIGFTQN